MFKAFAKTTKFIFNVIVFGFSKEAISKVTPDKRLGAITSQNLSLKSDLRKINMTVLAEYHLFTCYLRAPDYHCLSETR
jgi:hypothetical protein